MTAKCLNWCSAAFAFIAAALWFWSALTRVPAKFPITVTSEQEIADMRLGGSISSVGSSPELDDLGKSLNRQSGLSAKAAFAAAVAALCQGIALLL